MHPTNLYKKQFSVGMQLHFSIFIYISQLRVRIWFSVYLFFLKYFNQKNHKTKNININGKTHGNSQLNKSMQNRLRSKVFPGKHTFLYCKFIYLLFG